MNLKALVYISVFTISTLLNGIEITGEGIASYKLESKKNALADLSNRISVEVKSDFKTFTSVIADDYKSSKEKLVQISSNLPIISADFSYFEENGFIKTLALISKENSLKGYESELERLKKEIDSSYNNLTNIKSDTIKFETLSDILENIKSFNKHKIVAVMLGAKNLLSLDISENEIKTALLKLQEKVNSIELAAKVLTKDIDKRYIYVSAPTTSISSQITQFAKILKDEISKNINTTKYSHNAKYFFRGTYEILDDEIYVSMSLYDDNNKVLKTSSIKLSSDAYKNISYKPSNKSFDEAINTEFVKSGNLQVSIGFKGYNRAEGIDLTQDDIIDIVIKTNKPICYFLMGHTLHKDNQFSYVLPIGSDESPFISYITGDDVNRLVTILEEIPISEPFGSENLQIFASTYKNNCELDVPKCLENSDGYCVVAGDPKGVIVKTRGLNIKKKKFKAEKAENNISWTSFKK